jgi:hypothetical protein
MSTTKTPAAEHDAERLYAERERRISDALALRKPDRVPVISLFGSFPAKYCGLTHEEEANDSQKCFAANFKANLDFQPDMVVPSPAVTGSVLRVLGYKQMKWAGYGLPPDVGYQAVEGEWMKPEEYDDLIYDPSDFKSGNTGPGHSASSRSSNRFRRYGRSSATSPLPWASWLSACRKLQKRWMP